jgi:hypothetical protein
MTTGRRDNSRAFLASLAPIFLLVWSDEAPGGAGGGEREVDGEADSNAGWTSGRAPDGRLIAPAWPFQSLLSHELLQRVGGPWTLRSARFSLIIARRQRSLERDPRRNRVLSYVNLDSQIETQIYAEPV